MGEFSHLAVNAYRTRQLARRIFIYYANAKAYRRITSQFDRGVYAHRDMVRGQHRQSAVVRCGGGSRLPNRTYVMANFKVSVCHARRPHSFLLPYVTAIPRDMTIPPPSFPLESRIYITSALPGGKGGPQKADEVREVA